jgi:hypothetical protein
MLLCAGIWRAVFREGATWNSPVILASEAPDDAAAMGLGTTGVWTTGA